jgi:hypothetical protein
VPRRYVSTVDDPYDTIIYGSIPKQSIARTDVHSTRQ